MTRRHIKGDSMQDARPAVLSRYVSLTSDHTAAKAFWIVTFAILTAIAAQIEIPLTPVPLTLQTFFVLLSGAFLGRTNGFLSMSLYLILGISGLPVFAGGGFGLHSLLGPTGGYLLAFPFAAFTIGYLLSLRKTRVFVVLAMTAGLVVIFALGTLQLNLVYFHNWSESAKAGLLAFSAWDLVKLVAASSIYSQFLERAKS
jgi:biotin transport system substrate-specific component